MHALRSCGLKVRDCRRPTYTLARQLRCRPFTPDRRPISSQEIPIHRSKPSKMTTEATARAFMSSPHFAVVGASSNPAKFGHKIFAWYVQHQLPATPINPGSAAIEAAGSAHPTLPSLAALPDPAHTSVSVITPPAATLEVLREAARLGVPAVWLQPGTFDDAVLAFARGGGEGGGEGYQGHVVAGDGGRGSEGWCVLVDGERALQAAGKL